MKGEIIREVLAKKGIQQSEIAKLLNDTPNNLNNKLSKDDIRTGLLESISEVSNIPISVFYGEAYGSVQIHGNHIATGDNTVNGNDDRLLNLLVSKDEQLTMAMKQTSKAQEQMDRVLDKFCGKVEG